MSDADENGRPQTGSSEQNGNLFEYTQDICIELSNLCNMADAHHQCPVNRMQHEHNVLPARIVNDVLRTLHRHGYAGRISFHTYNEPLIDPRLFEFVRLARKACPYADIHICTNGYCLTQNMADELVAAGVTSFHISAYSTNDKERFSALSIPVKHDIQLMKLDDRVNFYDAPENGCDKPCFAPLCQIIVTARGIITLCCLDWKREYCFGNLNTQSFEDAISGDEMRQTYARLSRGDRFLSLCKRCGWSRGSNTPVARKPNNNERSLPEPIEITTTNGRRVTIDTVEDLSEFTGLGIDEVGRLIRRTGYTSRDEFKEVMFRETSDFWFYIASRYFIFENAIHTQTIDEFVQRQVPVGGAIWEFGGGTGNVSLALAAQGYDVSYTELGSLQKDFVAFRSYKYKLPIRIIHSWQPKPVECFDLVLALDVLEHIEDYDKVLLELCNSVKPGGLIWETSAFLKDPANPTHHIVDAHDYRKLMRDNGFERIFGCITGRLWCKRNICGLVSCDDQTLAHISEYAAGLLPATTPSDKYIVTMVARGLEEVAVGNFGLALDYLEEAWTTNDKISGSQLFSHVATLVGEHIARLEDALTDILRLEPTKNHRLLAEMNKYVIAHRHTRDGMAMLSNGNVESAIERFDAALALSRTIPGLIQATTMALTRHGMALLTKGNAGAAIERLDAAIALSYPMPNLYYAKAVALAQLGRYGSARIACMEELKVQPDHKGTLDLLVRLEAALQTIEAGSKGSDQEAEQMHEHTFAASTAEITQQAIGRKTETITGLVQSTLGELVEPACCVAVHNDAERGGSTMNIVSESQGHSRSDHASKFGGIWDKVLQDDPPEVIRAKEVLRQHYESRLKNIWMVRDAPVWFDHEIDFSRWPHNLFWIERGVFGRMLMKSGCNVLDMCCGDGYFSDIWYSTIAGSIDACDNDDGAIAFAKTRHANAKIQYHSFDLLSDPLPKSQYDVITWFEAIEHFDEEQIDFIVRKLRRNLANDGCIVGSTPLVAELGGHNSQHKREFVRQKDVEAILKRAFSAVETWVTVYPARTTCYFRCLQREGEGR